jgi:hypothetical protein
MISLRLSADAGCASGSAIYVLYNVQTNQDPSQYEHALDDYFTVKGVVQPRAHAVRCPDHVPHAIRAVFDEGTDCLSIDCWNAAGAMFRKVLDLATKEKVPPGTKQQMLKARLEFLFANSLLPPGIKPLADCIREDGNDAVHEHPIGKDDAEDLLDFTTEVLEVLYTGPGKIIEAAKRREARRAKPD